MAETTRLELRTGSGSYSVVVGSGTIQRLPALLAELGLNGRLRIVADREVARLHGDTLRVSLGRLTGSTELLEVSGQERDKNLQAVARVWDWLLEVGTDQTDLVAAFGGGVVGDLVGFAAAAYLRGVRLVQLPTTLLAMVDSSIGGKTGVDHRAGKNLIGAFHQPGLVLADLDFLRTLPRREVAAGWAEVIKMGIIRSAELFERLEALPEEMLSLGPEAVWPIGRSIALKGEIVEVDEREVASGGGEGQVSRMLLNYGHTIGHAIEAATGYERLLHGEAVAIGMAGAAEIAVRLGLLDAASQRRQLDLLERFGLPTRCPGLGADDLWAPLRHDKKAAGGRLRWVLPTVIGEAQVVDAVPEEVVHKVLLELTEPRP